MGTSRLKLIAGEMDTACKLAKRGMVLENDLVDICLSQGDPVDRVRALYGNIIFADSSDLLALFLENDYDPALDRQALITAFLFASLETHVPALVISTVAQVDWVKVGLNKWMGQGLISDVIVAGEPLSDSVKGRFRDLAAKLNPGDNFSGEKGRAWLALFFSPDCAWRGDSLAIASQNTRTFHGFLHGILGATFFKEMALLAAGGLHQLAQNNPGTISAIEIIVELRGLSGFFHMDYGVDRGSVADLFGRFDTKYGLRTSDLQNSYAVMLTCVSEGVNRLFRQDTNPVNQIFEVISDRRVTFVHQFVIWKSFVQLDLDQLLLLTALIEHRNMLELFSFPRLHGDIRFAIARNTLKEAAAHFSVLGVSLDRLAEDPTRAGGIFNLGSYLLPWFIDVRAGFCFTAHFEQTWPRPLNLDDVSTAFSDLGRILFLSELSGSVDEGPVRQELRARFTRMHSRQAAVPVSILDWLRDKFDLREDPLQEAGNKWVGSTFSAASEVFFQAFGNSGAEYAEEALPAQINDVNFRVSVESGDFEAFVQALTTWICAIKAVQSRRLFVAQLATILLYIQESVVVDGIKPSNPRQFYDFYGPIFLRMLSVIANQEVDGVTTASTLQQTLGACVTGWLEATNLVLAAADIKSGDLTRMMMAHIFYRCQAALRDMEIAPILGQLEILPADQAAIEGGDNDDPHRVLLLQSLVYLFLGIDVKRYFPQDDHYDYEARLRADADQELRFRVFPRVFRLDHIVRAIAGQRTDESVSGGLARDTDQLGIMQELLAEQAPLGVAL